MIRINTRTNSTKVVYRKSISNYAHCGGISKTMGQHGDGGAKPKQPITIIPDIGCPQPTVVSYIYFAPEPTLCAPPRKWINERKYRIKYCSLLENRFINTAMLEKYEVIRNMFHGFNYKRFFELKPKDKIALLNTNIALYGKLHGEKMIIAVLTVMAGLG